MAGDWSVVRIIGNAMRHITRFIVVAGVLAAGLGSIAFGAAPTTQPGAGKVVVLPFARINPASQEALLGHAIRQGVLADLMAYAPGRAESLDQTVSDDKSAIDAARNAGAAYVVTGNLVTVGPEVRFDGRVLDVENGNAVASLKATGPADNLYPLETALADQLGQAIGLAMPAPPVAPAAGLTGNPWGANNYPPANPYAPTASDTGEGGGSDFGPSGYGYGGYPYGPYYGPGVVSPATSRHHHHGFGSFNGTPFGSLGVPSIAGGGGYPALDGGMPYGLFIPTNRAEYLQFNRYGGLGTVDITRPTGPVGSAPHATGAGRK